MANKTVTVKASGGDYTSLNAALAGENALIANLVANTCVLTIECYDLGTDDVPADTGGGWTTSASYYINIVAPAGQRHDGKWNTSKYRILRTGNSAGAGGFTNRANYTRLTGIQIKHASSASFDSLFGIYNYNDGLLLDKCLIWVNVNHGSCSTRGILATATNLEVRNTVFFENGTFKGATDHYGIVGSSSFSHALDNVTCSGFEYNFISGSATVLLRNCLSHDAGVGGYFYPSCTTTGSTNNLSDKNDAIGTITYNLKSIVFVDAANGDFHLAAGDTDAIDKGTDLSSFFTDDIDGATRTGTWDLGADEYVASGGGGGGGGSRNRSACIM